jgi:molybdate transport system substrate-binding protein
MLFRVFLGMIVFSVFLMGQTIKIAVATNVSYAINSLISEFNKINPDIKVEVILGSSGNLTAQIKNGAPYGLFMSANMKYPKNLYKNGYATTKPMVYAQGAIAYLSSKKQNFKKGIKILLEPNIKKIAIANPESAPYGKAAVEAMQNGGVYNKVKPKLVYAQTVSQAVIYSLKATDIGFVAKSSLFSPKMRKYKKGINWAEVNQKLYSPIKQGIVILKKGQNNLAINKFYKFILSKKAQKILVEYGYLVP